MHLEFSMTLETGLIHSDAQPTGTFEPNVAARYKKALGRD